MTKENKDLLLKYLCMALPYGVKLFKVNEPESAFELYSIDKESGEIKYYKYRGKSLEIGDMAHLFRTNDIPRFKPYLRPLSSMTEEEKEELKSLYDAENVTNESICFLEGGTLEEYEAETSFVFCYCIVEWLLEHHFDFIGLIPKGLAIEVTEEINYD